MNILEMMYKTNRWWNAGKVDPVFLYKNTRSEFEKVIELLDEKRILSLVGPRRVGKSTLLYQTVDYLIKTGVASNRILLFSGDEPALFKKEFDIEYIVELFIKEIVQEKIEQLTNKIYILIDEIHFIENWQLYLKSYYDKKYNIKFIISGSSSTLLFQQSKESLLGRIEEISILPLNFSQYLDFYYTYKYEDKNPCKLFDNNFFEDLPENYDIIKTRYFEIKEYENETYKILKEFLISGGYPEYFENSNILLWQKRLVEDIITKGIYKDIVSIYNIKNPEILEKMIFFMAANQGQPFSYTTIAQTLGLDVATTATYINYLAQTYLISVLDNYSTNIGKIIRKNKKMYVSDNGIRNALLRVEQFEPMVEGQLIENCAVQIVNLLAQKNQYKVFYWREEQKEVDIVLDKNKEVVPIEVKYRNTIEKKAIRGIQDFMKKFEALYGVVITKDTFKFEDNIYYIPFWVINI